MNSEKGRLEENNKNKGGFINPRWGLYKEREKEILIS